ncbi:hypothetical protein B0H10DRAFT_2017485 [Mycena sp. CBHHK59/15]|nr:hypothetical protein B0H10DRAFT_2017485 [Mycena sp. CBHHK59/15]
MLELKEIQQSLPHAAQPADPSRRHILSAVPIGLLPLAAPAPPPPLSVPVSAPVIQTQFVMPPGRPRPQPQPVRLASPALTHLRPPASPPAPRPRPAFAFLPLLAAPDSASSTTKPADDHPSYFHPYSHSAAADAGDPDRVAPPPQSACGSNTAFVFSPTHTHLTYNPHSLAGRLRAQGQGNPASSSKSHYNAAASSASNFSASYEQAYRVAEAAAYGSSSGAAAHGSGGDSTSGGKEVLSDVQAFARVPSRINAVAGPSTAKPRQKKKSYMLINDVEVEIEEDDDDDDEEEDEPPTPAQEVLDEVEAHEKPQMCALGVAAARSVATSPPPIPSSSAPSQKPLIVTADKQTQTQTRTQEPQRQPQTSPRLAVRPLSPSTTRPLSPSSTRPLSPAVGLSPSASRPMSPSVTSPMPPSASRPLSPVQARASSRLVRV